LGIAALLLDVVAAETDRIDYNNSQRAFKEDGADNHLEIQRMLWILGLAVHTNSTAK